MSDRKKPTHGIKDHGAATPPPADNTQPIPAGGPQFGKPAPTPDPAKFTVQHGSDGTAYFKTPGKSYVTR